MTVTSPSDRQPTGQLDGPPPAAPAERRRSMVEAQRDAAPKPGLGEMAGSPQVMALQGLQMMERGSQMLGNALPTLGPQLTALLAQLRDIVPRAMAEPAGGVPENVTPGGSMPMMPPPGAMG